MTRTGKIARLPKHLRTELNQRLEDGEVGVKLVEWLNRHKEVKEVLKDKFGGRPINEQNLSDWKQGGYVEWLRNEETCERVHRLAERAQDLDSAVGDVKIGDLLGNVLAAELADAAAKLDEIADPQERWKRFREILRELARLRSEDHHAQRIQLHRERWENQVERQDAADEEERKEDFRDRAMDACMAPMNNQIMAEGFGGGAYGKKMAEMAEIINSDLSLEEMSASLKKISGPAKPGQIKANQGESSQIKVV